jgi:glutamate-1-semialdehyde aminotransferase
MTNCAMVLPQPGFWNAMRAACDAAGNPVDY